jgi:hypothetical protein
MNTSMRQIILLVFCLMFLLVGCTVTTEPLASPTGSQVFPSDIPSTITANLENFTPIPTKENTVTPSSIVTATPLPSDSPTAFPPTWTPLPTLNPEDVQYLLKDLFENNTGCHLPCWWGFVPGKTSWKEAEQFLSQFALYIGKVTGGSKSDSYVNVKIPSPSTQLESKWVDVYYITQDYLVRDGIIETIKINNFDLIPAYYLPTFLKTYGKPSGIWIRTFREEEQNSQPFLLDLFYPDKGILIEYSGGTTKDLGDRLQICLERIDSPFLYLWSPDESMTFDEATKKFLDTENFPQPVPLLDATGMDIEVFYESIIDSGSVCIETPKDLWP